jgi:hypothetical protein
VTVTASRPIAANDVRGWALRQAPGHVRTVSAITPIARLGVTRGSNAGISSFTVTHHDSGTGGFCQILGSLN